MTTHHNLRDTIHFDPIRKDRDSYFVVYGVPNENEAFANLQLVYPEPVPPKQVAQAMETELDYWARRYPAPIMVTAFNEVEDVIRLDPIRPGDRVIGWVDPPDQLRIHWETNVKIPGEPFTKERLLATYKDIPRRVSTAEDKRKNLNAMAGRGRLIRRVVIVWFVAIPISIAVLTQVDQRLGWAATILSILQGLWKLSALMGWRKPSKRQRQKEAEKSRTREHDYYCRRDPAAFNRLKVGVLTREIRERTLKEAEELKRRER